MAKDTQKTKTNREPGIHMHTTKRRMNGRRQWYWIFISKNGKTLARSSEMYKSRRSAVTSIYRLFDHFTDNQHFYDHTEKGYEKSANIIVL